MCETATPHSDEPLAGSTILATIARVEETATGLFAEMRWTDPRSGAPGKAVYKFIRGPSGSVAPVLPGDTAEFVARDPAGERGARSGPYVVYDNAPLASAPLLRAGVSDELIAKHFDSLFAGPPRRGARKMSAGDFLAALRRAAAEADESPGECLTRLAHTYASLRRDEEVFANPDVMMCKTAFDSLAPKKGAARRLRAPRKDRDAPRAAAFVVGVAGKGLGGAVSPRQLEYILTTWYARHAFRPFELLGIERAQVLKILRRPFFRGDALSARARAQCRAGGRGACVLEDAGENNTWCGFCSAEPLLASPKRDAVGKDESLTAAYAAVLANPFAFADVPLPAARRIHHAQTASAPTGAQLFCGGLARRLEELSHSSCEIFSRAASDEQFSELVARRAVAEAGYGVRFFDRPDGSVCAYSYERHQVEAICARFFGGVIRHFASEAAARPGAPPAPAARDKAEVDLSPEQSAAVEAIVAMTRQPGDRVMCVTGGPGVGKTRILGEVVARLAAQNAQFRLSAFTGKAVARIREQTDCPARLAGTLDRLIAKRDVLDYEHLIIDEASMVRPDLFARFIVAREAARRAHARRERGAGGAKPSTDVGVKVTFVGDVDQLPPVGWGSLFASVLAMPREFFPRFVLTHSFRLTGDGARLARAFECVKSGGDVARALSEAGGDESLRVVEAAAQSGLECAARLVDEMIRDGRVGAPSDVGVIAPFNAAVDRLNEMLKSVFARRSAAGGAVRAGGQRLAVGDRVMMSKNVYFPAPAPPPSGEGRALAVAGDDSGGGFAYMNGEVGVVASATASGVRVDFDTGESGVEFLWRAHAPGLRASLPDYKMRTHGDCEEEDDVPHLAGEDDHFSSVPLAPGALSAEMLKLAFALTVHKSQGSEYEHVIVLVPRTRDDATAGARNLLTRPLLYTAMTRARKSLTLVTPGSVARDVQAVVDRLPPPRAGNLLFQTAACAGRVSPPHAAALALLRRADEAPPLTA